MNRPVFQLCKTVAVWLINHVGALQMMAVRVIDVIITQTSTIRPPSWATPYAGDAPVLGLPHYVRWATDP